MEHRRYKKTIPHRFQTPSRRTIKHLFFHQTRHSNPIFSHIFPHPLPTMQLTTTLLAATLALTPLTTAAPSLSARQSAAIKTGYYNIANSLAPLLTLNTNTNVTGNGTVSLPQSQVWAVTELAGNYLILNNGTGAALQGFGSKLLKVDVGLKCRG